MKFEGYKGTFYVIDESIRFDGHYYLLESEIYGDEAPALVGLKVNDEVMIIGETYESLRYFLSDEI